MLRLISALVVLTVSKSLCDGARNKTAAVDPSISGFLNYTPFFDLTKIPQISLECRRDFRTYLTAIDSLELWALKSENFRRGQVAATSR